MDPVKIIDRGRGPELATIRITIYDILPYVLKGWRADSIAISFGIRIVEVEALVRYFEEHREEILAMNRKILERIARGNPPEVQPKLQVGRAKLRALRQELAPRRLQSATGEWNPDSRIT